MPTSSTIEISERMKFHAARIGDVRDLLRLNVSR